MFAVRRLGPLDYLVFEKSGKNKGRRLCRLCLEHDAKRIASAMNKAFTNAGA